MDITAIAIVDDSLDVGQVLLERLQGTKKMVGMGIFYSGAILHRIQQEKLWKGRAETFEAFCESEFTSYGFAMTAIRIFKSYCLELQLPLPTIEQLAQRDYTSLDKAAAVITRGNAEEWIPKLVELSRQDVVKEIRAEKGEPELSLDAVEKVVRSYRRLHQDERAEFHRRIMEGKG